MVGEPVDVRVQTAGVLGCVAGVCCLEARRLVCGVVGEPDYIRV